MRWDIFCSVVDNFGDIGVCWRLARQLAAEHAANVRLWVDDLTPSGSSLPRSTCTQWRRGWATSRSVRGKRLFHRPSRPTSSSKPSVVSCLLPMSKPWQSGRVRRCGSTWSILAPKLGRRLSWTAVAASATAAGQVFFLSRVHRTYRGCAHRTRFEPAPPGVPARSGRDAAVSDGLGVQGETQGEILVSLFCYPQAPLTALLDALAAATRRSG